MNDSGKRQEGGAEHGFRRIAGIDRSGPKPASTRQNQPWRPWTLPNLIGYLRLVGVAVFLYLAFKSEGQPSALSIVIFVAVAAGDYFDGLVARATGQYSRLGALMDPFTDRLVALSGALVCWHFELLPRWALLLLIGREIAALVLARVALGRGVELEINWVGRFGTAFVFGGLLAGMIWGTWPAAVLFILGVAIGFYAMVLYIQAARRGQFVA